jgi:hypothetical protein|tara:strand:- start:3387 stop:3524 length:138 start_codon:yes stop_codon:yes gene_type:complete
MKKDPYYLKLTMREQFDIWVLYWFETDPVKKAQILRAINYGPQKK